MKTAKIVPPLLAFALAFLCYAGLTHWRNRSLKEVPEVEGGGDMGRSSARGQKLDGKEAGDPRSTEASYLRPPPSPVSHQEYLLDQAYREAQSAAVEATLSFRTELLRPVEFNAASFAERLYDKMPKLSSFKSREEYRQVVAKVFYDELNNDEAIRKNLEATVFTYLAKLDRISQQYALDLGRDIQDLPVLKLTLTDFEQTVRTNVLKSVSEYAEVARQHQRRDNIQGGTIGGLTVALSFVTPMPFLVDLVVGVMIEEAVDYVVERATGSKEVRSKLANEAANRIADLTCYGDTGSGGLQEIFLFVAQKQREQLGLAFAKSRPLE